MVRDISKKQKGQPGRTPLVERGHDFYQTPREATEALLRAEAWTPTQIWEPCAGKGAISRVLMEAGHEVIADDLCDYPDADYYINPDLDFFSRPAAPPGFSKIVTNPPFKDANRFIRHGLALDCEVVVLLRLMALEGANRSDLIDRHLARVWVGIERLPPMHRDGWAGNKVTSSAVAYAWFVFSPQIRPADTPVALRRISWRAA